MKNLSLASLCVSLSDDPVRDMDAHLLVLYSIARFLPAKVVVEIGTDDGSSTLPLLLAVAENGGKLISIDPAPCPSAHKAVEASGCANVWEHWQMLSADAASQFRDESLDLVLIDGDHSYEGVSCDWRHYEPKVKRGGLILFHDALNTKDFPGIARLIDEEIRPEWQTWETCTLPYGWGCTICRKR